MGNNRGSQTGRPEGQIKDYSHNNLQKNTELKAALTGSTVGQKAKKKDAYSMLHLEVAEGDGVRVDEVGDE